MKNKDIIEALRKEVSAPEMPSFDSIMIYAFLKYGCSKHNKRPAEIAKILDGILPPKIKKLKIS